MKIVNNNVMAVGADNKTAVIPFSFTYIPLTKLALINFEKSPDSNYVGLEPQYIDDEQIGTGYRVIAYRQDGYVDVYDDISLNDDKDDSFDVTGKGLCERVKVEMENTRFEKVDDRVLISFQFKDKYGRKIVTNIEEKSARKTNGLNLLAPIGSSTENPTYLPLFFLYNFDFVRKNKTKIEVTIDGKSMILDDFPYPIPKDFQWRYFTRYSSDCQIIEFANASDGFLEEYTLIDQNKVTNEFIDYHFDEDGSLLKIFSKNRPHLLVVEFFRGLPDIRSIADHSEFVDKFKISADNNMGFISGDYSVKRNGNIVSIELIPSGGWTAVPDSFFTKMMFGNKSVFCTWTKTYKYTQTIDISTLKSTSKWERIKV